MREHIQMYSNYQFGTIEVMYLLDETEKQMSMVLLPAGMKPRFHERAEWLEDDSLKSAGIRMRSWDVGNLCHLALRHHPQANFAGNTLKGGYSTRQLKFFNQTAVENPDKETVITELRAEEGYTVIHRVSHYKGENGIEVETTFHNRTGRKIQLDMMTSFVLDNLSPLQRDDAPYKLSLHRYRGNWSLEGKHCEDSVEDLNLENTWYFAGQESERYGVRGSYPVKQFFPFGAVEDKEYGVFWGAQLAVNASWQMEFSRDKQCYSLSGGLGDCEFAGWWKELEEGESFAAPKAFLSVSDKGLNGLCANLTEMHHKYADMQPEAEKELPAVFNEWCTTWGHPNEKEILNIAEKLEGSPVKYIVIDAGWSKSNDPDKGGQGGNGDWELDREKFPDGLKPLSRKLREKGFKLGIWFEFEVTTRGARVYEKEYDDMHLKRNGEVIVSGDGRSFWDFRRQEVVAYLRTKVIDFLKENEIGYMKVDYNGSIGFGCDGAESQGEGLRTQMEAVRDFFAEIRERLPELVIENCASGGHRLEPSMMDITAMSSFSDAHECTEIPRIAARLHNMILPRQSQVWAVVKPELTEQQLYYRLAAGFLGRMCISGDLFGLRPEQEKIVKDALDFYESCKGIIKYGETDIYGDCTSNAHHLRGMQAVVRRGKEGGILVVCHSFAESGTDGAEIMLPEGEWAVTDSFGRAKGWEIQDRMLKIVPSGEYEGAAFLLENLTRKSRTHV